jgi:Trk K+ transport system NAD-binding subunit
VLLVDTNRENIVAARHLGLPTYEGSVLSDQAIDALDLAGIGRLLALTQNSAVNELAASKLARVFGRSEIYQVAPGESRKSDVKSSGDTHARLLFSRDLTCAEMQRRVLRGAVIRATPLTSEFDYESFRARHGDDARVLFIQSENGKITIVTVDRTVAPTPGQTVIALHTAEAAKQLAADRVIKAAEAKSRTDT